MNKHELMLAMPTVKVKYSEIEKALEKEKESLTMAKRFIQSISLSHYLESDLIELDVEKAIDLFDYLKSQGFSICVNNFSFYGHDDGVNDHASNFDYKIGYKFISNLIENQTDITDEVITIDGDEITYGQLFACDLIVSRGDMQLGDKPTVMTILTAQKALFALFCTINNIKKLTEAEGDVEIIQTLPILL